MTPTAEDRILSALGDLGTKVGQMAERLVRVETKLEVVDGHGRRLDRHEERITAVEQAQLTSTARAGRFAWSDVAKVIAAVASLGGIITAAFVVANQIGG